MKAGDLLFKSRSDILSREERAAIRKAVKKVAAKRREAKK